MANTIKHKRGTTTPAAGQLVVGELAINTTTGGVFTKTDGGAVVAVGIEGAVSWGSINGTLSNQTDLNTALGLKAPLASPTFTGDPQAPTPATSDNDTSIATTAFVKAQGYLTSGDSIVLSAGNSITFPDATVQTTATLTGPAGPTGPAGSPWVYRGAYDNFVVYAGNDYVTLNGSSYVFINFIGAAGYGPITHPAAWQLVANKGETGATGATGADGTPADLSLYATKASPTFTGTVTIPSGASISGFAPLASPSLTGNVTITTNSANPALIIVQDGAGDVVQFKDVTSDSTYSFINASGKVNTIASVTANAGLNIPHGTAPTSPVDGDIWTTTSGVLARVNSTTQTLSPLASPTFTGTPAAPTAATSTNTTQIATTAYVKANLSSYATTSALTSTLTGYTPTASLNNQLIATDVSEIYSDSYTLTVSDANSVIKISNDGTASSHTIYLPDDTTAALPVGSQVVFVQMDSYNAVFSATAFGTMYCRGSRTTMNGQYAVATAIKVASSTWVLSGDLV